MINSIKKVFSISFAIVAAIFTFIPEAFFGEYSWISQEYLSKCQWLENIRAYEINIVISRLACFILVVIVTSIFYSIILKMRKRVIISGQNYIIQIEYGNIFKKRNCKRVISFDECFTTTVGDATSDINSKSVCGQYLSSNPTLDIQKLIENNGIKQGKHKSKFQNKVRYDSGTIVPNGDDLLLAFAPLDEKGKGRFFTRDDYITCLDRLWRELENYYSEKDVCIPILGAGTTSFEGGEGASITQQDLLNTIIWSYRLSSHKIKAPHKLRIICKRTKDFSINEIDR